MGCGTSLVRLGVEHHLFHRHGRAFVSWGNLNFSRLYFFPFSADVLCSARSEPLLPEEFEIPACASCKDGEIHTSVELSPAGSCGLCQQPGAAPRTPCLPRWAQHFSSFQPGCCSEGCLLVPILCVGCAVVFKCGASGANISFWETPHGVGRHQ